jgi:hypothetical protein
MIMSQPTFYGEYNLPPTPPQPQRNWLELLARIVVISLLGFLSAWLL